ASRVLVFLILAALYQSWSLPWSVLLSTPVAVAGAYVGLWARGLENDVYAQIGLLMLIGLSAKNAILIVEYAKAELEKGASLVDAALVAAGGRGPPRSAGCDARAGAREPMIGRACAAVAAVVLFAGCAPTAEPRGLFGRLWRLEVGPQYRRPPVDMPDDFRGRIGPADAASFADLPWWEVFRSEEHTSELQSPD